MFRTARPRWISALAIGATVIAMPSVSRAAVAGPQSARLVLSTAECASDGVTLRGVVQLNVSAGSTVTHTYRVGPSAPPATPMGADVVPIVFDLAKDQAYNDSVFFGGVFNGGPPFAYEQITHVYASGSETTGQLVYRQTVTVTCSRSGDPGTIAASEWIIDANAPPDPTANPVASLDAQPAAFVVAQPSFTG